MPSRACNVQSNLQHHWRSADNVALPLENEACHKLSEYNYSNIERETLSPKAIYGGEGGIRTHDTLAGMPHFECGAFDHSATSPHARTLALRAPLKHQ